MKEAEENIHDADERKRKIRERYRGVDSDSLDFIPAREKENIRKTDAERRVAVYARVSTDDPNQTSSYELQKNHYNDFVNKHPNWKLVKIYADEGISGTSLQHRDSFIEMIHDCELGGIDMIITKSVSRFARNIVDCIKIERDLKKLSPPVGVLFETENIFTLDDDSEVLLSIMAMMAQEESHTKSEIMNASIEMRFRRGIFLTPSLLGYDQDEDGNLVINEDEAKIVRLIFFMYLYGYTCQEIADKLTSLGCHTKKGNNRWSAGSILQILQNERHCGDVLARKTFTPNYLDHKSKKNNMDRNQYRMRNHHESIVSRDDFIAVQRLLQNAKYGNKGLLPELKAIPDGILKGFVCIHPRWAGFKPDDYHTASQCACDTGDTAFPTTDEVKAQSGDFDLRGYEIARGQFFQTANRISVTFSMDGIAFTTEAVRKFGKEISVELLIHPGKKLLAVRPGTKDSRHAIKWARIRNGAVYPRPIKGSAFLPTLFALFDWNTGCKYRVIGIHRKKESESVLLFNLCETEVIIPNGMLPDNPGSSPGSSGMNPFTSGSKKGILAYPADWSEHFGNAFYAHARSDDTADYNGDWNSRAEGQAYITPDIQATGEEALQKGISEIVNELKETKHNE